MVHSIALPDSSSLGWHAAAAPVRRASRGKGLERKSSERMESRSEDGPSREQTARRMADCIAAIAASRDRAAFEELFRYFAPRVEAYLRRLGAAQPAAEELMQEAMVTVWRKAGQFDPQKASASTWLFTIVRNLRIDAYRRDRRPELDPDDPALAPDPDPQADAVLFGQQSSVRLHEALKLLNDNERMILNLAYFDDRSHSEIAAELGIPLGTVKSRIRLAFAKLRNALGDSLGGEP